jgi:anthranilate phosphoribosyltransferase
VLILRKIHHRREFTLQNKQDSYPSFKEFVPYLQAIGRGQRSGRSLTQNEAYVAMTLLLENKITPEQRGAFLMLLRVREETAEEIAGFTQACRATLPAILTHNKSPLVDLDIGAYAGKRRQLPWFLLAIACLTEQGVKVGMHGTQEPASQRLYIQSVLAQLSSLIGVDEKPSSNNSSNDVSQRQGNFWQANTLSDIGSKIKQSGFVYADLALLHPQLDELIQLRELFGLRSCANTLARLLNPFNAGHSVQGVHHKHVDDKHVSVAHLLNDNNVLCFRGEGGEPEVDPSKESVLKFNRQGEQQSLLLAPEQRWEVKPKALDVNTLMLVWQGAQLHSYGESTVISTLAALLMLLQKQSHSAAFMEAKKLWNARKFKYFIGVDLR